MRIDAFNHFYPAGYYKQMEEVGSDLKDMFRRARAVKSIHDLDTRLQDRRAVSRLRADSVSAGSNARHGEQGRARGRPGACQDR